MKTTTYQRSEILSFYDLTEAQQLEAVDSLGADGAQEASYVELEGDALPLCMFVRTGNTLRRHGMWGVSYFSAYFVTLSRCGSEAIVEYSYN
jgi:hypothetical protein